MPIFVTILDLDSAFWQVPLRNKDREKTRFACELGLFQWKKTPSVLCNATATFQRLMAQALTRILKKYGNLVMCYVDDVVIATPTLADHIDRFDEFFQSMKKAGMKCKLSKCEIRANMEGPQNGYTAHEFPGICQLLPRVHKKNADKVQQLLHNKGKKFE